MLKTAERVFIVRILVKQMVKGKERADFHAVVVSTISEPGKPHGKVIDNWKLPLYLEEKDKKSANAAKGVFYKLFSDRTIHCQITPCDVYELVHRMVD